MNASNEKSAENVNPLSGLAAAELAVAAAPFLAALDKIKNGDGTVASVVGQGVALEGELIAALPTIQKIGVQNVASFLIDKINQALANVTPTPTPAPSPEPAPDSAS